MVQARELVQEVVNLGLAPMLKEHGFKKNGLSFLRRRGAVTHYLNIQLSSWNQGSEGSFYLNAGLMFDEICRHYGKEPPKTPKQHDCNFMVRIERLNSSLPPQFSVNERANLTELAQSLSEAVEKTYVIPLENVTNLGEFATTGWTESVPWGFPALFHFLTGNKNEARRLVQLEADTFADRGVTFASVAEGLGLRFS